MLPLSPSNNFTPSSYGVGALPVRQIFDLRCGQRLEAKVPTAHPRTQECFGLERLQKYLEEHEVHMGVHRIKRLRAVLLTKRMSRYITTSRICHG
ncbi:hypothetical protein [Paraburkholderia sp. JPY419]|uniref:Uncharacterized protein n=1 Tax=Paraburkholderia youngii TaxID=2782701 RepID=A0ABX2P0B7_9BURK|nr:hypothetical protein [Paraburkholderia youngii]